VAISMSWNRLSISGKASDRKHSRNGSKCSFMPK
jgi:hypothetical protein